jgi:myo-inositol-1(or 4)-monophosphatase
MKSVYQRELEFARELAREAGDIMRKYFDGDQQTQIKGDGTPVTIADTTINKLVIERIAAQFPGDGVVGEEESTAEYGMGRRWICDPLDGTFPFTIGVPTSTFSLAFVVDGRPVMGVAYHPQLDHTYWAVHGGGAFCDDRRLKVSADNIESATIATPAEYVSSRFIGSTFMNKVLALEKRLAIFDGAVMRGCLVASGHMAGFPHPMVKPHDIAAAHLLVEEAGGKVTGLKGEPIDYSKYFEGAILSNGVVHDDLLALFKD